jgi:hypothetical protein
VLSFSSLADLFLLPWITLKHHFFAHQLIEVWIGQEWAPKRHICFSPCRYPRSTTGFAHRGGVGGPTIRVQHVCGLEAARLSVKSSCVGVPTLLLLSRPVLASDAGGFGSAGFDSTPRRLSLFFSSFFVPLFPAGEATIWTRIWTRRTLAPRSLLFSGSGRWSVVSGRRKKVEDNSSRDFFLAKTRANDMSHSRRTPHQTRKRSHKCFGEHTKFSLRYSACGFIKG